MVKLVIVTEMTKLGLDFGSVRYGFAVLVPDLVVRGHSAANFSAPNFDKRKETAVLLCSCHKRSFIAGFHQNRVEIVQSV